MITSLYSHKAKTLHEVAQSVIENLNSLNKACRAVCIHLEYRDDGKVFGYYKMDYMDAEKLRHFGYEVEAYQYALRVKYGVVYEVFEHPHQYSSMSFEAIGTVWGIELSPEQVERVLSKDYEYTISYILIGEELDSLNDKERKGDNE